MEIAGARGETENGGYESSSLISRPSGKRAKRKTRRRPMNQVPDDRTSLPKSPLICYAARILTQAAVHARVYTRRSICGRITADISVQPRRYSFEYTMVPSPFLSRSPRVGIHGLAVRWNATRIPAYPPRGNAREAEPR